jgi:hypothetical protein
MQKVQKNYWQSLIAWSVLGYALLRVFIIFVSTERWVFIILPSVVFYAFFIFNSIRLKKTPSFLRMLGSYYVFLILIMSFQFIYGLLFNVQYLPYLRVLIWSFISFVLLTFFHIIQVLINKYSNNAG